MEKEKLWVSFQDCCNPAPDKFRDNLRFSLYPVFDITAADPIFDVQVVNLLLSEPL